MKEIFKNYLVTEFAEDYTEGHLSRRQALKLIAGVTGSFLVANSILAGCAAPPEQTAAPTLAPTPTAEPQPTAAPTNTSEPTATQPAPTDTQAAEPASGTVMPDDPDLQAGMIEFSGEDGASIAAYLAHPVGEEPRPVILVCHENRGLTPHIQDVARRLAKAGYVGLAVDLLSRSGGTDQVGNENVPGVLGNTSPEQFVSDFRSGWRYLAGQPFALPERVGMVGFCFGGGVTWLMATQMPELKAAAPFYGPHPPLEDVPNIRAAVRAIYAGNDQRINSGIEAIEKAMLENSKVFEKIIYPNVEHAFHNDTSPRYNREAAVDAWAKTLEWFGMYV